jgi:nicotinamide riboside transporter PnuC
MNNKINTSLYYLSITAVVGSTIWYVVSDVLLNQVFTVLILIIAAIEIGSLILVSKRFPESHTQFKIGLIVGLLVLLGIKQMAPSFFPSLTVTVLAVNFVYNFYTNAKAKKGAFRRREGKKLQF